jgi:threonine dehydratase
MSLDMMISIEDIRAAAARIKDVAVETPVLRSPALDERVGAPVLIKAETLQRVGAFKFRGAYNRLSQIPEAGRTAGVVAFSSGNHAQGVALAARLLDMPAVIVMPSDAPAVKAEATRAYGAEIRFYDRLTEDRGAIAQAIAADRGAVLVPSFDDADIIAGQGTVGLELARQARELGVELSRVAAPIGGGGLIAGCAIALKDALPAVEIHGVEPEVYDDTRQSLAAGRRIAIRPGVRTLCDALESPSPGVLTFPVIAEHVSTVATVSDTEVMAAVRYACETLKLVVEPGGAVALAALLAGKLPGDGPAGIILSGGNIEPELLARVMNSPPGETMRKDMRANMPATPPGNTPCLSKP